MSEAIMKYNIDEFELYIPILLVLGQFFVCLIYCLKGFFLHRPYHSITTGPHCFTNKTAMEGSIRDKNIEYGLQKDQLLHTTLLNMTKLKIFYKACLQFRKQKLHSFWRRYFFVIFERVVWSCQSIFIKPAFTILVVYETFMAVLLLSSDVDDKFNAIEIL